MREGVYRDVSAEHERGGKESDGVTLRFTMGLHSPAFATSQLEVCSLIGDMLVFKADLLCFWCLATGTA